MSNKADTIIIAALEHYADVCADGGFSGSEQDDAPVAMSLAERFRKLSDPAVSKIMVLSDGDTYTALHGCTIREERPEDGEELAVGADPHHIIADGGLPVILTFGEDI